MNAIDFSDIIYGDPKVDIYNATLFGAKVLFTVSRINHATVPEKLYTYDLREVNDGYTIEKFVGVNHAGTIISAIPLTDIVDNQSYIDVPSDLLDIDDEDGHTTSLTPYLCISDYGEFKYDESLVHLSDPHRKSVRILLVQPTGGLDGECVHDIIQELVEGFNPSHYQLMVVTDCYKREWNESRLATCEYIANILENINTIDYVAFPMDDDIKYGLEKAICKACDVEMINMSDEYWTWDITENGGDNK